MVPTMSRRLPVPGVTPAPLADAEIRRIAARLARGEPWGHILPGYAQSPKYIKARVGQLAAGLIDERAQAGDGPFSVLQ